MHVLAIFSSVCNITLFFTSNFCNLLTSRSVEIIAIKTKKIFLEKPLVLSEYVYQTNIVFFVKCHSSKNLVEVFIVCVKTGNFKTTKRQSKIFTDDFKSKKTY